MPVTCENSDSAISSSIRDSIGNSLGNYNSTKASNLGLTKNQLTAALKQSLLKPIEYVESPPGFGFSIQDTLKAKYTILRPSEEDKATAQSGKIIIPNYFPFVGTFFILHNNTLLFFLLFFRSVFFLPSLIYTSVTHQRH